MQFAKFYSLVYRIPHNILEGHSLKTKFITKSFHFREAAAFTRCIKRPLLHPSLRQRTISSKFKFSCSRSTHSQIKENEKVENTQTRPDEAEEPPVKLSLFKRYKKMLKEYWYVLLPVHMVTSAVWFGAFYYAASRGVDIKPFLEYINLPEVLIAPLRNPFLGNIAVASAIYKLATPARYMVTLGVSSVSVKTLTRRGLIKPVPTKAELKTIIKSKLEKKSD